MISRFDVLDWRINILSASEKAISTVTEASLELFYLVFNYVIILRVVNFM